MHVRKLLSWGLFSFFILSAQLQAEVIRPEMLRFKYQDLNAPWPSYNCKHSPSRVMFDWDVECEVEKKLYKFTVHLVVSFYKRTSMGMSGYEVLYWVTNHLAGRDQKYDSTTLWMHSRVPDAKANVIELFQGIENDMSSLRMMIDLRSES